MKRLRNLWSKFLLWLFGDDDKDLLSAFEGDLFEDLREELADYIEKDKMETERYIGIMDKIQLGVELTGSEQCDSGFIQL